MISLQNLKRAYLIGIKGVGMTALAQILQSQGTVVSGSDVAEPFFTDAVLKRHNIPVREGFDAANVPQDVDVVITSTAYDDTHVERRAAKRLQLPILTYPEALGLLFNAREGVAIAGTHGKTTSTALVGAILARAGKDPTVLVGSNVKDFGGNALVGASPLFVAETDEYQNKFRYYHPHHLLLTNVEYDHPDFFPTKKSYREAFAAFIAKLPKGGTLVWNVDDAESRSLCGKLRRPSITFGQSVRASFRVISAQWASEKQTVNIAYDGETHTLETRLPGLHNALNIAGAAALCHALGVSWGHITDAVASFVGTERRFEFKGTHKGAIIIDDYAHHPTELAASIAACRACFPDRRLIAVFQPHTYSRTKALLKEFAHALAADRVILLDIYASARERVQTVSSADLAAALPSHIPSEVVAKPEDAVEALRNDVGPTDIILLLGAGDVWRVAPLLQKAP